MPTGNVHEDVIREFYPNAFMEGDHINCWLKGREFLISRELIQDVLEVCPTTPHTSLQYDERREKLEPLVEILGGQINKKALHTIMFTSEMRTFAYIMIFNLYPVRNLTNLSSPRYILNQFLSQQTCLLAPESAHQPLTYWIMYMSVIIATKDSLVTLAYEIDPCFQNLQN